jgi:UDP-N-acetylmuramate dehydrogenase
MINIQQNIPLASFTSFKIGGPAKFFVEIKNENEILEALDFAKKNNLEIFVLGGGSNILISDKGFDGLVIRVLNSEYQIQNEKIECDAGAILSQIINEAAKNNLTGIEWAAGIPGTVGGAICGNAGAYGKCMADNVESVKVIEIQNAKIKIFKNNDCRFDYRNSIFKQNKGLVILSCTLKLQNGKEEKIKNKVREIIRKRNEKLPKNFSAGSFFQNPVVKDENLIRRFEEDTREKCRDGKISAGWLIGEMGLKGKQIGGAQVSEKHGNFIINKNKATAQDIVTLVSLIKTKLRDELGIKLEEEIQYVGF